MPDLQGATHDGCDVSQFFRGDVASASKSGAIETREGVNKEPRWRGRERESRCEE